MNADLIVPAIIGAGIVAGMVRAGFGRRCTRCGLPIGRYDPVFHAGTRCPMCRGPL